MKKIIVLILLCVIVAPVLAIIDNEGDIGVKTMGRKDTIYIVDVLPGSPAESAGLKNGSQLLKINGIKVDKLGLVGVQDELKGPVDTNVTLNIKYYSEKKTLNVKRKTITQPDTSSKFYLYWKQVAPQDYVNATKIKAFDDYPGYIKTSIRKNNKWVDEQEKFRNGYAVCEKRPQNEQDKCLDDLVMRKIK